MEEELVAEVKRKHPTLKELIPMMRKYGFGEKGKMKHVFLKHNLVIYINQRDPVIKQIHKKNAKQVSNMYKEMKTISWRKAYQNKTRKR
jgi:hypothetical protein